MSALTLATIGLSACDQPGASAPEPPASPAVAVTSTAAPVENAALTTPNAVSASEAERASPTANHLDIDTASLPSACLDYVNRYLVCTARMPNADMATGMNASLTQTMQTLIAQEDKTQLPGSCERMTQAMRNTPMMEDC